MEPILGYSAWLDPQDRPACEECPCGEWEDQREECKEAGGCNCHARPGDAEAWAADEWYDVRKYQ